MNNESLPFFIQLEGPLFEAVVTSELFSDGKTFVDAIPKNPSKAILSAFLEERSSPDFCLKSFVEKHFLLPQTDEPHPEKPASMQAYIQQTWPLLTKPMSAQSDEDTLLSLPFPHLVPGGRFREGFYWDTYFAMLGLYTDKDYEALGQLLDNFNYLVELLGFIPNGNRIYFLSRSQPPVFSLMIELMQLSLSKGALHRCRLNLEKEHGFWMRGAPVAKSHNRAEKHVVYVAQQGYKGCLNRYFDPLDKPRPEAFYKETKLGETYYQKGFFSQLRAVCESGWDFSSRFLKEEGNLATSYALSLAPIDLHCLLYLSEKQLFAFYQGQDEPKADYYKTCMEQREKALHTLFWGGDFFYDYNFEQEKRTPHKTLAALFPLYANLATKEQAKIVAQSVKEAFLQPGGFVTTLTHSTHQWDWPNGWAPLQWITVVGLLNYGFKELALEGAKRWVAMVDKLYKEKGAMLEKYNVVKASSEVAIGQYAPQEGFGWTNGVTRAFQALLETGKLPTKP